MGNAKWIPPHKRRRWRWERWIVFTFLWPIFGEYGVAAWQRTGAYLWPFSWARRNFRKAWDWHYGPQSGFVPYQPAA